MFTLYQDTQYVNVCIPSQDSVKFVSHNYEKCHYNSEKGLWH